LKKVGLRFVFMNEVSYLCGYENYHRKNAQEIRISEGGKS
jgi:hypothetical protein